MVFRRATFSSCKEALDARKKANYYWWESYCSFNHLSSYFMRWFMEVYELEGRSEL